MVRITRLALYDDPSQPLLSPFLQPSSSFTQLEYRKTIKRPLFRQGWKGLSRVGTWSVVGSSLMLIATSFYILYNALSEGPIHRHSFHLTNLTVAVPSRECQLASERVLTLQGSTVDAAIVAVLCSGLINSYASGIGGGAFMMIYPTAKSFVREHVLQDWKDEQGSGFHRNDPIMIDCRETAPAAATFDMFVHQNATYGGLASGIPGELWCLYKAHSVYGKRPWSELIQPLVKMARDGFHVPLNMELRLRIYKDRILKNPYLSRIYAPQGRLLQQGDVCVRREFAVALEQVALGIDHFYKGPMAESLIQTIQEAGGIVTVQDLLDYQPRLRRPIQGTYKGYTITVPQAPSAGPVLLSMLNVYEQYNESQISPLSMHRLVETIKLGTAKKTRLGDPSSTPSLYSYIDRIVEKKTAQEDVQKISHDRTFPPEHYADQGQLFSSPHEQGTCHISILGHFDDDTTEAVSITTTINFPFGSNVVNEEYGIILNDQMGDFSVPGTKNALGHPSNPVNHPQPGRRPLSSMTPLIAQHPRTKHTVVIGGSGGPLIFPSVFQSLIALLDQRVSCQQAVSSPRLYHPLAPNSIVMEDDFMTRYPDIHQGFLDRGHTVFPLPPRQYIWSLVQAAQYTPGFALEAAADPRVNLVGSGQYLPI